MSADSLSAVPKYCRQRERGRSDRAYVRIEGKKIPLGAYGSPESKDRYAELIGKPKASPTTTSGNPTVAVVMVAYLEYAERYYRRPDGVPGREFELIREVLRFVRKNCSDIHAKDFGPKRLKEIREQLIKADHSRKYINKNVDRIRRMFKWAAAEELIPASVPQALSMVAGLKRGRTEAREMAPVMPVDDTVVDATLKHLPEVVADMVRFQRLTGCRPNEVCQLRPCDLNRTEDVWTYRPSSHKTEHFGKDRVIFCGPKAQAILLRYLARDAKAYCFRPCDSEEKRLAAQQAARVTPESCGNTRGTNRVLTPKRSAGEQYATGSYRRAIHRGADKAFPAPEGIDGEELKAWRKKHRWSPNRLRHSAATEIRREFGLEAAQVILGHSDACITQVYAERDFAKGAEVARKIG